MMHFLYHQDVISFLHFALLKTFFFFVVLKALGSNSLSLLSHQGFFFFFIIKFLFMMTQHCKFVNNHTLTNKKFTGF